MTSSPPPPPPRFPPPGSTPPFPPGGHGAGGAPPGSAGSAAPGRRRSPAFWVAIGCLGCVTLPVLLLALFAGVIGGGAFYLTREPVGVVKTQLVEIRDGRLDAAYARFTAAAQERLSRSDFDDLVAGHEALRENADATFWNRSLSDGRLRLSGTLSSRSGAREAVAYDVVREGDAWKIAAIRVGEDAEPEPDKP